ncbi:MAG: energy-coupling factor transporter ATPase [Anaerolineae bacterium]
MNEPIISIQNLHFSYNADSDDPIKALDDINLEVMPGEYLVIVGHNGSGKSTLAKHLNALLLPGQGEVVVAGMNTKDLDHTLDIRSTVGMVFQIPDNQIVATVVEQDVAFGPENLGVPVGELRQRVDWALEVVQMEAFRDRAPHLLSAGQKQRVAIAGVMAMKPRVLVLDESTAMLDPSGREGVLAAVDALHEGGTTIIAITHFMWEAVKADRVVVMEAGKIMMEGSPRQVFSRVEELRALQLDVPQVTELTYLLNRRDPTIPPDLVTVDEVVDLIAQRNGQVVAVDREARTR